MFGFIRDIEHPDIRYAMATGNSPYAEKQLCCERCGEELGEDVYADLEYDNLCEYCLLELHKKAW